MAAQIIPFITRAQLLERRGPRNYGRWMMLVKNHVEEEGPERRKWKQEEAAEAVADRRWAKHHSPVEGGAWLARFFSVDLYAQSEPSTPNCRPRRNARTAV